MVKNKKTLKTKWKEMSKAKRFMFLGIFLILITGVSAYYYITWNKTITGSVTGGVDSFSVTQDLNNFILSVNESLEDVQVLIINNPNGNLLLDYNLTINETNLDPVNCDSNGDLSYELENIDGIINDGGNFTMYSGSNEFNFTTSAINDRACPTDIELTLNFE